MTARFVNATWARLVCAVLIIALCPIATVPRPALAAAQQTSEAPPASTELDACTTAQQDASRDANKPLWFLAGCLIGVTGIIIAYIVAPSAPQGRLIGKSPEWVATYVDCYERKGKSVQGSAAVTGCLLSTAAWTVTYIALIAAASTTE